MWAGPVPEGGFVRAEVRAVADVAQRSRGDSAIEPAKAVCTPEMEDDVAVAEGW